MTINRFISILVGIIWGFNLIITTPVRAEEKVIEKIVAKVDYGVITMSDLMEASMPSIQQIRQKYPPEKWDSMISDVQKQILMQLINEYVCVRFARENDIVITDEEIEATIANIRENAGMQDDASFRKQLTEEGLSLDELKENLRRQTAVRKVLGREIRSKIRVTEAEIKAFRQENSDQFETKAKIRIGVLMLNEDSQGLFGKETTKNKIFEIYEKLENGADFEALVKEFSDGPAADQGGDVGFLEKNETLPAIATATETLAVGDYSKPVETDFGWVIIKLLEKIDAGIQPLSEIRDNIKRTIQIQKSREMESAWFERQRAKTYIQIMK